MIDAHVMNELQYNPFAFGHFGLSRCRLVFDGRPYPYNEEEAEARLDVDTPKEVERRVSATGNLDRVISDTTGAPLVALLVGGLRG
ncbi:MAG: hypothetical protein GY740_08475 [Gammaproteobacteria bacterium]|nr:hypothetical protein [Gammaproteobacteria bacterium]